MNASSQRPPSLPSSADAAAPTSAANPAAEHTRPAALSEQQALQALAEKGFIHDAAHQLRIPLAGIISQAELALQENDPQQLHQRIRKIHAAAQRGAQLVKQMLALARSEATEPSHIATEAYDIAQLAREVAREWIPKSLSLNKDLGYEGAHSAWVHGNRFMMREAIGNLIDNALNYTAANGHVTVRVQLVAAPQDAAAVLAASAASIASPNQPVLEPQTATAPDARPADAHDRQANTAQSDSSSERPRPPCQATLSSSAPSASPASSASSATPSPANGPSQTQPGNTPASASASNSKRNNNPCRHPPVPESVILEVIDNGPGVAPEHLPHVFERFWRADDEHSSGSGLGLPLVERIAAQHGGHASAHNAQPHGFIVRLSLPAARHSVRGQNQSQSQD
ncbi:MAG: HAMP domain-containing sensor histidine kinase [Brachymonas sp.]|nr:HAMP domain-containing sensor histidine kinase [Brachymonas sp.]